MNQIENNYVFETYNYIAEHFSSTRYSHWVTVKKYLLELNNNSNLKNKINFLDFGCGNGKYLSFGNNFNTFAFDNCARLLDIVKKSYPNVNVIQGDVSSDLAGLNILGLNPNSFDSIISVAVLHHLSSESRRIQAILNIFNLLRLGGTCLITVWANTIEIKPNFLKLGLPNDYLIPWNNEFQRYYHLFESDELEKLFEKAGIYDRIQLVEKIFECDNWIMIFKKII